MGGSDVEEKCPPSHRCLPESTLVYIPSTFADFFLPPVYSPPYLVEGCYPAKPGFADGLSWGEAYLL